MTTIPAPVSLQIESSLGGRNRLTVAFRPILAIPHLLLVDSFTRIGGGVLGLVADVCAVISWFAILFTGKHPRGLWDVAAMFVRWHARVATYTALLRDEYPPFGDGDYAVQLDLAYPDGPRNRLTVGFRPILVLPHIFVLVFLMIAWLVTSVVAWFAILFTGRYPAGLYGFAAGMLRWLLRVECYALLLRDEYPPFSLS